MAQTQTETTGGHYAGVINDQALARHVGDIEKLIGERNAVNRRITAVYRKAKEAGFQTPILREIIRERSLEAQVRADRYALLDSYRKALGMYVDTPLGEATMRRAAGETPIEEAIKTAEQRTAENVAAAERTRDARTGGNGATATKPKPFAQQPMSTPGETTRRGRGRPRKVIFDREHPDGLPPAA